MDGFPAFGTQSNPTVIYNREYNKLIGNNIWDKILHFYFYPKIKEELDHNPYERFKTEFALIRENTLNTDFINRRNLLSKKMHLIFWYQQIWVEGESENLAEFKELVQIHHNNLGILEGEKITKILEQSSIVTPTDLINVFILCFNSAHDDRKVELVRREYETRGSFELPVAYFTTTSLRV